MDRRIFVSSLVWIVCGILVIAIRTLVLLSGAVLEWAILGGAMVAYGSARLLWNLIRASPAEPVS